MFALEKRISHPYRIKQKKNIKEETVAKRTPSPDPPLPGSGLDYIIKRPRQRHSSELLTKTSALTLQCLKHQKMQQRTLSAEVRWCPRVAGIAGDVRERTCPRKEIYICAFIYFRNIDAMILVRVSAQEKS